METKTGMNFKRVLNCPSYFCEHVQTRSCPVPDVWTGETDWNGVVENLCVEWTDLPMCGRHTTERQDRLCGGQLKTAAVDTDSNMWTASSHWLCH